eukprot:COSAG01_NODE_53435_length_339_cov_0.845833_1_plen_62_part_10
MRQSTPYFRHIKADDEPLVGKQGYVHGSLSGPATPDTTVTPPKRPSESQVSAQVQKSFPGPP